ncbi:MAG TPA: phosphoribosyltransferase family protein [Candidatus Babeliales bacterium]|nr:phosphoribosyltransferase family protein [Candidatus Babeliales bacterium]
MIIAPPICAYCKTFLIHRTILCTLCQNKIKPVVSYELTITATYSIQVFAICDYKDPIRTFILAKKYSNLTAAHQLGMLVWKLTDLHNQTFDYIIPVPLHWRRYAQRNYNQAAQMAYGIQKQSTIPVLHALKRVHATIHQSELSHNERTENVKNAFITAKSMQDILYNKRILLIDDLMTTGATLRACVQELRKAKPCSITIGVGSRVV